MNAIGSLIFGGQTFFDANGQPLALGYVVTKLAGTGTLQATFSDVGLTTPNANSNTLANTLRLNSAGRPVTPMYFSPVPSGTAAVGYDVYIYDSTGTLAQTIEDVTVPAPSGSANLTSIVMGFGAAQTLTISGGVIVPTANNVLMNPEGSAADNLDTIAVTGLPDGALLALANTNGSASITVRHNQGNIFTSDGNSIVLATTIQRLLLMRYGANWYQISSQGSIGPQGVQGPSGAQGIQGATGPAGSGGSDPIGSWKGYAGASLPSDYFWCDGSVKSQTTYADLYTAIGSAWNTGGEGAGNFRLPDFRDVTIIGKGTTFSTLGAGGGTMAAHSHTNPSTADAGPTAITGTSGAGSAHSHGLGLSNAAASGAELVVDGDVTAEESAHTHGAGSYEMPAHAHTQGDTGTASHLMAYKVSNVIIRYQ